MEKLVIGGIYQHYKGKLCKLLNLGKLEEDLDEVVIYQELEYSREYGNNPIWVRRKNIFLEEVEFNGKTVPRFKYLEDK
ncbi:MAG: DUF1653 domain-containing protein [Nanobdellota archaeon]